MVDFPIRLLLQTRENTTLMTTRDTTITPAEEAALKQVSSLNIDEDSMFAVSNVFRVANLVRNYTERNLLNDYGLTFSGFTVLWVLWINGRMESRALADESGISKSTLTGVVKTLEKQSLVVRKPHAQTVAKYLFTPRAKVNQR